MTDLSQLAKSLTKAQRESWFPAVIAVVTLIAVERKFGSTASFWLGVGWISYGVIDFAFEFVAHIRLRAHLKGQADER